MVCVHQPQRLSQSPGLTQDGQKTVLQDDSDHSSHQSSPRLSIAKQVVVEVCVVEVVVAVSVVVVRVVVVVREQISHVLSHRCSKTPPMAYSELHMWPGCGKFTPPSQWLGSSS